MKNFIKKHHKEKIRNPWVISLLVILGVGASLLSYSLFIQSARAEGVTYYVDTTGTNDASHGTATGASAFKTIQYAINDSRVVAGDTINVAAGTYVEQVVINKSLTLSGTDNPTIKAPASPTGYTMTESSATFEPVVFAFGGTLTGSAISGASQVTVNISGITIDGNARIPSPTSRRAVGILYRNIVGGVTDCTVQNMGHSTATLASWGILTYGTLDATIHGNTISGYGVAGIGISGVALPDIEHVVIDGNTVTGTTSIFSGGTNGIQVGYGSTGHVTNNTVTLNHIGANNSAGILIVSAPNVIVEGNTVTSNDLGIVVQGLETVVNGFSYSTNTIIRNNTIAGNLQQGILIDRRSVDTSILNNTITGNNYGILVGNATTVNRIPPTGTLIHNNSISGSTSYGLYVYTNVAQAVDATSNWWGSADTATIQSKISSNVSFSPYYVDAEKTILSDTSYTAWIDQGVGYTAPADGSAYYPSAVYDTNGFGVGASRYAMWYSDGNGSVYLVRSTDGVAWGEPTSLTGIVNAHHAQVLYDVSCFGIVPCNTETIKYKMWFWDMGANLYSISSLATAESADGIHWSTAVAVTQNSSAKLVQDPNSGTGWNQGTYGPISLFYQPNATNIGTEPWNYSYVMYYEGTDGGHEDTGLAYSIDGLEWSAYSVNPVLSHALTGGSEAWNCYAAAYGTVFKDSSGYHYFYSGKGQDNGSGGCAESPSFVGIGYASSTDGKTWVKDPSPIFHISDGVSYRSGRVYTPSVIHDDSTTLRMYFTAMDAAGGPKKIGYATLTNAPGSTSQFSLDNPGDVSAGTRIGYTVSRKDYYGAAVTTGATTVYLYSSSTGSNKKFYAAASGGSAITSIVIPEGVSSVKFWAYDEKAGNWFITASDNATSPDAVGTADASDALTVQPAAVAKLLLNNPGEMSVGTRLGYTVTREDQFNNLVTSGVTLAYFYSSSSATTTAFYIANTGGAPTTFATINDGDSTGSIWYYNETLGNWIVTVSDSATVPAVDTGITDAVDSVTVSALPIVATRFVILPPSEVQVGTPAVVTVEAQDDAGNIDTTIQSGVTLHTTGSATGAGLVTMVNGVGTLSLSDTVVETVTLSLLDTQSTHLDVLSTQSLLFSAAPVAPATGGGGGGGGGSASLVPMITGVQISGHAFPNAFVLVFAVSPGGVTIEGQTTANANGAFSLLLKGVSAGIGFYGIVGVDNLGRTTQIRAFNANYTNTNTLLLLNAELSPALGLVHPTVRKSDVVGFVGFAVPGYTIGAQVDGATISQTTTAAMDGSYKILFPTGALTIGSHTVRIQQVSPNGTRSDYTPQKVFNVTTLFTPQTDFNQDGVINVQDWSIFLSRWSSTIPSVHMLDDLNGDGKVDVSDLSIFVRTLKK